MAAVDGVLYGDDPAQGIVEGRQFLHPDLRLAFTVPNGYGMQNGTSAVSISGNGGQAQFSTAPYSGDMNAYIASVLRAIGGDANLTPSAIQRTTVRSEEHTSELQSLMRISYAVFCLKKTKPKQSHNT